MATTQSTQRVAQVAGSQNFNDRIDDKRTIEGAVQFAYIDVPIEGDESASSVIDLLELPPGAIVIPEQSFVQVTDDFAGTATLDIGDAENPDRYADGIDAAAPGRVEFMSGGVPEAFGTRYRVSNGNRLIQATLATLGTPAAGAFRVVLAYKNI